MRRNRILTTSLLVLLLMSFRAEAAPSQQTAEEAERRAPLSKASSAPSITVHAASGATVRFTTQNGQMTDDVPPQVLDLPHLVLYRNGDLTRPDERTLIVTVKDLVLPPSGLTITLTLQTYHSDPDLGGAFDNRITTWRESRRLDNPADLDGTGGTVIFEHEFGATVESGTERVATPTDYFRYELAIIDEGFSASGPVYTHSEDYAFLLENQWIASLKREQTSPDSAGPEELIVYYCDMFVFQHDPAQPATRLGRQTVPTYVQNELVPAMREAFRVQMVNWGFPWEQAWTSYRAEDGSKRLSVALTDGETWFHGEAPLRGHSGISLRTKGGTNANYDTLAAGLLSTFHHELFHSLQRGMVQESAGHGDVDGQDDAWGFFSEGTAVLAESVAQPGTQFAQTSRPRTYLSHANGFIGRTNYHSELNSSYGKMTPYRAGIYWRFLYERCGGMENGTEDPSSGMRVVRKALEVLYSEVVKDTRSSADLARNLPAVMDQVLKGTEAPLCPFDTFRESIQHLARAIYGLRLEGGRCTAPGTPTGCGFYDPNSLYFDPHVSTITYTGTRITFASDDQPYPRGVRSSFGIDFVDVVLDPVTQGQSLTIEFSGAQGGNSEFRVEIWKLMDPGIRGESRQRLLPVASPEQLAKNATHGHLTYAISEIDTGISNRVGLIITRLDSEEDSDPVGAYTIILQSNHGM